MRIFFDKKLFITLVLGFVVFTSLGTVTHETGHYLSGRYVGIGASVHYGFTAIDSMPISFRRNNDTIQALRKKHHGIGKNTGYNMYSAATNFSEQNRYESLLRRQQRTAFLFIVGGPAQTMITGTIGLVLLIVNRKRWLNKQTHTGLLWLCVFTALFWLRQSFNLMMALKTVLFNGRWPAGMDETKLAVHLHLWPPILSLLTGIIGFSVLFYIVFYIIPIAQRVTFIAAGLVGGTFGYWLWLIYLGPRLMP